MKSHEMDQAALERAADYVLESLSDRDRQQFEKHLADCSACRAEVNTLTGLAGALSEPVALAMTEGGPRPDLWSRLEQQLDFAGDAIDGTAGMRAGQVDFRFDEAGGWKPAPISGVMTRVLRADYEADRVTYEALLDPGAIYPGHKHHGPEECYVVHGDLWVGDVHMRAGDYQCLGGDTKHAVQSTDEGCRLLLVSSVADSPLAWA